MFDVPMRLYSILLVFHPGRPLNGNQHIMFDVPMWLYSIIVGFSPRPPAAGIDAATPRGPKRLPPQQKPMYGNATGGDAIYCGDAKYCV